MKERPILFSGAMVRSLLAGTKTQTRRVMKPQPQPNGMWVKSLNNFTCLIDEYPPDATIWRGGILGGDIHAEDYCPYGVVGDRLWVRESFMLVGGGDPGIPLYRANWREDARARGLENIPTDEPKGCTPSIHMPRWAARIILEVTDVRVERLNDISEEDAMAEGIEWNPNLDPCGPCKWRHYMKPNTGVFPAPASFESLWDSINGKGSWDANPWVWAVTFKRVAA